MLTGSRKRATYGRCAAFALLLGALAAGQLAQAAGEPKSPTAAEKYKQLQQQIGKTRPALEAAKAKSARIETETAALRARLVATAAHAQELEAQQTGLRSKIRELNLQEKQNVARLSGQRVRLMRLLAILERLQQDLPPPVALQQGDTLQAARATMVLSASLPRVYAETARLSRAIASLRSVRAELVKRRAQAAMTVKALGAARRALDQLLAIKQAEAKKAADRYAVLNARLETIAADAQDIKSLLDRVAALRVKAVDPGTVVVGNSGASHAGESRFETLRRPVIGPVVAGGPEGIGGNQAPGLSFAASPAATVVAPADCEVLFAGRYHKAGQVLILQASGGYDLVLAGLDRVDVRPGDQLLAGEPLGRMPMAANGAKLYFEVRRNGKGVSPAPWLGIDLRKAKKS